VNLEFNKVKRDKTLQERGLDFARANEIFAGFISLGKTTEKATKNIASSQ
jgi:uncharacterized DUF497 family protein